MIYKLSLLCNRCPLHYCICVFIVKIESYFINNIENKIQLDGGQLEYVIFKTQNKF